MKTQHHLPLRALGLGIALTLGPWASALAVPMPFLPPGQSDVNTDYTRSVDPSLRPSMVPIEHALAKRVDHTRKLEADGSRARLRAALEDDLIFDDPMEQPVNTQDSLRMALADLSQPHVVTPADYTASRAEINQAVNDASDDLYDSVSADSEPDSSMGG